MKIKTKSRKEIRKLVSINLPEEYPWKVCSKLMLDLQEYLPETDFKRLDCILRNRDQVGYMELAEDWGLQSIGPSYVSGFSKLKARYLLASLIKKFQFPSDRAMRVQRATDNFVAAELACKSYNAFSYKDLTESGTDWGTKIFSYARIFLTRLLGAELPGHLALLSRSRHGPGATTDTRHGLISAYHKYAEWPYACTAGAYRYAQFAIATDQRWIGALQDSYRERFGIPKHYPIDERRFWSDVIKVVDGNRITFVPKDAQKERTIAIEPTLNLYLQLGVDGFIRRNLKRFGVDLDSQEKNQRLARMGSLHDGEDSFVTIDLSSASDSISLKLCELLLPSQWYSYLMDLRSPCGVLEKENIVYEKISSMGNGYTFALESAIFAAIVYAVMKAGGAHFNHERFAVFGDDIIVERRWYFQMVEALRMAGFRINLEKTFSFGPIRESCGTDWFRGKPLRPVFLDKVPTNVMELWTDSNRLKRLLSLRFGIEDSKCLEMLRKWIPEKARCFIGPLSDEDFDSYLHVEAPPKGAYVHWRYEYDRIVSSPIPQKGTSFLFRKLMHDLRGNPPPTHKWDKWSEVCGQGSRFTVTRRNALTVGISHSTAVTWRSEYGECLPGLEY